jgi:hypothetical protein
VPEEDDPKALLPADLGDRDVEATRRERNQRRRRFRRYNRRATWLAEVERRDPALHAELVALRAQSGQAFRRALIEAMKKLGMYAYFEGYGPRELDPLDERRTEGEDDEG